MEGKTDFRIRKTCAALVEALTQLLNEKRFEAITINELCARASIRRATFYNHFADKYEFFAFAVRYLLSNCYMESQPEAETHICCEEILYRVIDFIKQNEHAINNLLESGMLSSLLTILSEQVSIDLMQKLNQEEARGTALPATPKVLASFYAGALIYTFRCWSIQRNDEQELVTQLTRILELPLTCPSSFTERNLHRPTGEASAT